MMNVCFICGNQEFYLEAGFYFCKECDTQQEDKQEEITENRFDPTTRARKKRIKSIKNTIETEIEGLTSWEKYNFVIHGLTKELCNLGYDVKLTVLQLWTTYLRKIEVAFMSKRIQKFPRLSLHYKKKDVQLIYGNQGKKGRKRKRTGTSSVSVITVSKSDDDSSVASSATSRSSRTRALSKHKRLWIENEYMRNQSDSDAMSGTNVSLYSLQSSTSKKKQTAALPRRFNKFAKEQVKKNKEKIKSLKTKKEKTEMIEKINGKAQNLGKVDYLCFSKLWGILYIALRIHDTDIHLSDLLRLQKEGYLYKKLENLFPEDVEDEEEVNGDEKKLPDIILTHQLLIDTTSKLIKFLDVWEIPSPNLVSLIQRYCIELQLPSGISLYAERILAKSPPVFTVKRGKMYTQFPNYEGKAMAIIIMIMKILFGLDDVTEIEISRVVDKINIAAQERGDTTKLFSFCEWQRYIECRKTIIICQHYPTKFKYDPKSPTELSNLYLDYLKEFQPINDLENKINHKTTASSQTAIKLADTMKNNIKQLIDESLLEPPLNENKNEFSLTPMYSYLEKLKNDLDKDIPAILRLDFTSSKIGYTTNPDTFKEVAAENGFDLTIIDSSANYAEKIVPTFDCASGTQLKLPEIFNEFIPVEIISAQDQNNIQAKNNNTDDYLSYFHNKNPGKIFINEKKKKIYEKMCKNNAQVFDKKKIEENAVDDFGFGFVLENGKLYVPDEYVDHSDSDDDVDDNNIVYQNSVLLSKYEKENPGEPVCKSTYKSQESKNSSDKNEPCNCIMCEKFSDEENEIIDIENDKKNNKDQNKSSHSETNPVDSDPEISILSESIKTKDKKLKPEIIFRPFTDFWLRRVADWQKMTNTQFMEIKSNLPFNYRWLLNECSKTIDVEEKSLYHEVCRVESYFADVVSDDFDARKSSKFYQSTNYQSAQYRALIKTRWLN